MTNQTTKTRKLSNRFINQYDAIGYDLWEISKNLKQILKKEKNNVAQSLYEASCLIAGALIELEKNKKLQSLINKSKSKASKSILYSIENIEEEQEAYMKLYAE